MQSKESHSRATTALNHPDSEEWMAYLYEEVVPQRKRELHAHLAACPACEKQLQEWRASMSSLDAWELQSLPRKASFRQPMTIAKWVAAAAIMLCVGFAAGKIGSNRTKEVAELKATVAKLSEQMNVLSNANSSASSRSEALQLMAEYSRLDEERRLEDRRTMVAALREMELRLGKLRTELETVALNTESGFRQTKEGLATLASYALNDDATDQKHFDSKN